MRINWLLPFLSILLYIPLTAQCDIIEVGDILEVSVLGVDELTEKRVAVGSDGTIFLPLAGKVKAESLTCDSLEKEIAEKIELWVKNPFVSVLMVQPAKNKVYVFGQVLEPGVYSFKNGNTVVDALGFAKGALKNADVDKIYLTRKTGLEIRFDIKAAYKVMLEPLDIIQVPALKDVIFLGEVLRPGPLPSESKEMVLSDLMDKVGGFTKDADLKHIKVIKSKKSSTINLEKGSDAILIPGDVVIVPRKRNIIIETLEFANRFVPVISLCLTIYLLMR
ncbi:MAG: polysaccharide biosynthesis/export family protein [bacterium]|nr:polysaccharide biosynthesis/export family protein [bacterium]